MGTTPLIRSVCFIGYAAGFDILDRFDFYLKKDLILLSLMSQDELHGHRRFIARPTIDYGVGRS